MIDIDELRRLRAAGTQGAWTTGEGLLKNEAGLYVGPQRVMVGALAVKGRDYAVASTGPVSSPDSHADAALICAAVNSLPALLDELARTRAQLDEARARLAFAPGLVEAARNLETAIAGERNVQAVLGIHRIDCEPCVEMEGNACRDGAVMLKELRACRKATDAAMNTLRAALLKETP
jgi:hypothetical protein